MKHSSRLKDIAKIILHHHERWDGNGYPYQLAGEDIPLLSRIISLADSWSAMRTKRPYRPPLPVKKALHEIKKNRGRQFCPEVSDCFIKLYKNNQLIIN